MSKTIKILSERRVASPPAAEGDVLNFLSRTLQAHFIDGEPQGALEKLQTLLIALEKQEQTLSDWPDSASKARICTALAKARDTVARIVEDLARHPKDAASAHIGAVKMM
jgi:hypothetical protein